MAELGQTSILDVVQDFSKGWKLIGREQKSGVVLTRTRRGKDEKDACKRGKLMQPEGLECSVCTRDEEERRRER